MENQFVKPNNANLPKVDTIMVASFFATNPDFYSAEFRNAKTLVSSRESYGDDAIGYVQLQRDSNLCTIKCKICPEHKVHSKLYNVILIVDEKEEKVISVQCHDCTASLGGCKHSVAFLMWVHRRSEEPSCTSTECYWQRSKLAQVGSTIKFIKAKDLTKSKAVNVPNINEGNIVLTEFLAEAQMQKLDNCQLMKHRYHEPTDVQKLSLHYLFIKYQDEHDCDKFLERISHVFTDTNIKKIETETREQHKSDLWHSLRYGRVTASRAFEVSRCKTLDGSLISSIMGAKTPDTSAMKRGRTLEEQVRKIVETKIGNIEKCGLLISKHHPMFAVSPDGICNNNATIEIKCPSTKKTYMNYIADGKITKKFLCQVQMQMHVTGLKKCYFCVADSEFEKNHEVEIVKVSYDEEYCKNILDLVVTFWKSNIYPLLYRSTRLD